MVQSYYLKPGSTLMPGPRSSSIGGAGEAFSSVPTIARPLNVAGRSPWRSSPSQRVAVFWLAAAAGEDRVMVTNQPTQGGPASMEDIGGLEDRQRVDRWLEESQYLMGRIVPAYLDDCARARARLEVAELDNERLRTELNEARREIAELRGDLEFHRTERASVADSFGAIVEHAAALQKPIDNIARRLHAVSSVTTEI
jgi:hypothetical protein